MIDLSYLRKVSDNDESFIRTMVDNFLEYAPQYASEMQTAQHQGQWDLVAKIAHKLKPGCQYMGASTLHGQLTDLEDHIKAGPINELLVAQSVELIAQQCQQVCEALNKEDIS